MGDFNKEIMDSYTAKTDINVYVKMDSDTMDFMRVLVFGLSRKKNEASDLLGITPLELVAGLNRLLSCSTKGIKVHETKF
ncbi:MAG: hypothetical protein J1E56_05820 [Ruminococcus sp.]|nr:hypothetical protein [Ruminococcus sp.]